MILSGETIRQLGVFTPFNERTVQRGMSFGLSIAGYDVRISLEGVVGSPTFSPEHGNGVVLHTGDFLLASTVEHFAMPEDVLAIVHDKSTWARRGLALQNTVVEPGWRGHLTIELSNHGPHPLSIFEGDPIAQIIFHQLDRYPTKGYDGKYQDQGRGPVQARTE
jgi:dCTP deaminase